jgi:hypothetical protein
MGGGRMTVPADCGLYLGALVVLVPAHPDAVVRHEGAVLVALYPQGLLFRNGRGIRIWVSWVDLTVGHCRLEGTPDAHALMALATGAVLPRETIPA